MSKYTTRAGDLFNEGYNCSQAVVAAFCEEMDMDFETALKVSSSFGAGMGRSREVCGTVSGMFMVLGMQYGSNDPKDNVSKAEHYRMIQLLADKFKVENGSIECRELLGLNEPLHGQHTGDRIKKTSLCCISGLCYKNFRRSHKNNLN